MSRKITVAVVLAVSRTSMVDCPAADVADPAIAADVSGDVTVGGGDELGAGSERSRKGARSRALPLLVHLDAGPGPGRGAGPAFEVVVVQVALVQPDLGQDREAVRQLGRALCCSIALISAVDEQVQRAPRPRARHPAGDGSRRGSTARPGRGTGGRRSGSVSMPSSSVRGVETPRRVQDLGLDPGVHDQSFRTRLARRAAATKSGTQSCSGVRARPAGSRRAHACSRRPGSPPRVLAASSENVECTWKSPRRSTDAHGDQVAVALCRRVGGA